MYVHIILAVLLEIWLYGVLSVSTIFFLNTIWLKSDSRLTVYIFVVLLHNLGKENRESSAARHIRRFFKYSCLSGATTILIMCPRSLCFLLFLKLFDEKTGV